LGCDCSCPCAGKDHDDYDYPEQDLRPKNVLKSIGENRTPTFVEMVVDKNNSSQQETATYFPVKVRRKT
jgi:hypothetical protein